MAAHSKLHIPTQKDPTEQEMVTAMLLGEYFLSSSPYVVGGGWWFYEGWSFYTHSNHGHIAVRNVKSKPYPFDWEK